MLIYIGARDHPPQNSKNDIFVTTEYFLFKFFLKINYDFTHCDKHVSGTIRGDSRIA